MRRTDRPDNSFPAPARARRAPSVKVFRPPTFQDPSPLTGGTEKATRRPSPPPRSRRTKPIQGRNPSSPYEFFPNLRAAVVEHRADGVGGARQRDGDKRRAILARAQSTRVGGLPISVAEGSCSSGYSFDPQPELTVHVLAPTPRVAFARRRAPEIVALTTAHDLRPPCFNTGAGGDPVRIMRQSFRRASTSDKAPNPERRMFCFRPSTPKIASSSRIAHMDPSLVLIDLPAKNAFVGEEVPASSRHPEENGELGTSGVRNGPNCDAFEVPRAPRRSCAPSTTRVQTRGSRT